MRHSADQNATGGARHALRRCPERGGSKSRESGRGMASQGDPPHRAAGPRMLREIGGVAVLNFRSFADTERARWSVEYLEVWEKELGF